MRLDPVGWSVVLIGRWNPAILSPAGIKKYVFTLRDDQQIQVAVPLDGISAYQVTHPDGTLVVHVEDERLQIEVPKRTFVSLVEGMRAGRNALDALPVTPVSAVGFNLNFKTETVCQELVAATDCHIDNNFATQGYRIVGRSTGRSVSFGEGQINIAVVRNDNQFLVNCNFHLLSKEIQRVKAWLETPISQIQDSLLKIGRVLGIQLEERQDDNINQPHTE